MRQPRILLGGFDRPSRQLRRRASAALMSVAITCVALGPVESARAQEPTSIGGVAVARVAGADRIATSIEISRSAFESASAAVLARADDGADALVAAPLAHQLGGPILLVPGDELPDAVVRELDRLQVVDVVVMGGHGAIAAEVEQQLATKYQVRRVAGADRFETSAELARLLPPSSSQIYLAAADPGGSGYPDALAIAPVAASEGNPILLVERDRVPDSVRAAILELDSRAEGPSLVTVVGGTDVISQALSDDLGRNSGYYGTFSVWRIAGGNRYQTAAAAYDDAVDDVRQLLRPSGRWLASAATLDALAAGPAIAALGETLLLVDGDDLAGQPAVVERLRSRRTQLERVVLVGGQSAISADAEQQLREVLLQDDLDAPRCPADHLRATLQQSDGATGSQYQSVEIVNVGEVTCTLEGRPAVTLLDEQGRQIETSVRYTDDAVMVIPLASHGRESERHTPQPGQAGVGLVYRSQGGETCGPQGTERVVTATAVQIGLPSGAQLLAEAFDDSVHVRTCEGRLTVTPILDADLAFDGGSRARKPALRHRAWND